MNIELTEEEVKFLKQVLEMTSVQGPIAAETLINIVNKLNGKERKSNTGEDNQVSGN